MENGWNNYSRLSWWCNLYKRRYPIEFPLAIVAFSIGGHAEWNEKQRERAKLIAAAPELLKACQEALKMSA